MKKKGRKHNWIEEFILRPVFFIAEEHGKTILSISIVCLAMFVTRMPGKIVLPPEAHETIGEIPIIEHLDDGNLRGNRAFQDSYTHQTLSTSNDSVFIHTDNISYCYTGVCVFLNDY